MFELIQVKPARIQATPKGRHYIKANSRVYIPSLDSFTSLSDGTTYIFNDDRTQVKRIKNYI